MSKQHKTGFAVIAVMIAAFAVLAYGRFGGYAIAPPASLADPDSLTATEVRKPPANGFVQQPVILQANESDFNSYATSPSQDQQLSTPLDAGAQRGFINPAVPAEGQRPSLLPDPTLLQQSGEYENRKTDSPAYEPFPVEAGPAEFDDEDAKPFLPPLRLRPQSEFKFDSDATHFNSLRESQYHVRPAAGFDEQPTLLPSPADLQLKPIDTATRTQVVLPNDSFWLISERAYGTSIYYKALYHHNCGRFPQPDRLPAGTVVDVPPLDELHGMYPALCPMP